ncbi:MAG TPA: hypothetical protein VIG33_13495 [Pseudobdellovibrionaceae bacterium]|jgi:hypothetical protein
MKKEAILKVIAKDLGTDEVTQLNKLFKDISVPQIKFRMAGKNLGHFGYTVNIKNISTEGLKVFLANKVKLIKFEDIEQFEKAKPRVERPLRKKEPVKLAEKKRIAVKKEPPEKKMVRNSSLQGSRFIPPKSR